MVGLIQDIRAYNPNVHVPKAASPFVGGGGCSQSKATTKYKYDAIKLQPFPNHDYLFSSWTQMSFSVEMNLLQSEVDVLTQDKHFE